MTTSRLVLIAILAFLARPAIAITGAEPEFKKLADNVYAWVGKHNEANAMAIVTTQGVVVVDTGHSPSQTRAFLKKIDTVTTQPIRYLVVTQNHGDHIGGMPAFVPTAQVIAHDRVAKALAEMKPYQVKAWRSRFPERTQALKDLNPLDAILSFPDRMTLRLGGAIVEMFYVPDPYNDGDIGVWLPQHGVLHAGFVGYKERHPDIRPDYSHGTTAGMLKQLAAMIALKPKIVVPGHGPIADLADLMIMSEYIDLARKKVRGMMDKGLALDVIRKDFNMEEYKDWDLPDHFPIIAETIYREFRNEGPQIVDMSERQVKATIKSIAELGRFLTVTTDSGEELRLRISNETYVEGIADRALLKPGMKFSAIVQFPKGVTPPLGFLIMEFVFGG